MTCREPALATTRRIPIRRISVTDLLVIAAIAAALGYGSPATSSSMAASPIVVLHVEHHGVPGKTLPSRVWLEDGYAAVHVEPSQIRTGPDQHVARIAGVARGRTAHQVLRDHPLALGRGGPSITLPVADVADADPRRGHHESIVFSAAGEQLTERQALQSLPLPSAINIAEVLSCPYLHHLPRHDPGL